MRVLKIAGIVLGVLVLAVLGAKFYLIDSAALPAATRAPIDLTRVRELAVSLRGRLPESVQVAFVGRNELPSSAIVAGTGFAPREMVLTVFQVAYGSGRVLIDTAMTEEAYLEDSPEARFDAEQYAAVQEALRTADGVLLTHEHFDHIGGLANSAHLGAVTDKVFLTAEQAGNERALTYAAFPADALEKIEPLVYEDYQAISAGIVVIKAAGHTPGSQLIYVRLRNRREFLFVGDVAWSLANVVEETGRPRLVSRWFLNEDRDAVLHQLRALHDVMETTDVQLVVSHDGAHLRQLVADGVLVEGLE